MRVLADLAIRKCRPGLCRTEFEGSEGKLIADP